LIIRNGYHKVLEGSQISCEQLTRYLLQPIPFSVRAFVLPDLFAGKMHAILCRRWKGRVKGRDWYDLMWYPYLEFLFWSLDFSRILTARLFMIDNTVRKW
jgi:hypothetical protein